MLSGYFLEPDSGNASKSLHKRQFLLEWGGAARTRDEIQARGAGRAGPACPPSVRPCVTALLEPKGSNILKKPRTRRKNPKSEI